MAEEGFGDSTTTSPSPSVGVLMMLQNSRLHDPRGASVGTPAYLSGALWDLREASAHSHTHAVHQVLAFSFMCVLFKSTRLY